MVALTSAAGNRESQQHLLNRRHYDDHSESNRSIESCHCRLGSLRSERGRENEHPCFRVKDLPFCTGQDGSFACSLPRAYRKTLQEAQHDDHRVLESNRCGTGKTATCLSAGVPQPRSRGKELEGFSG